MRKLIDKAIFKFIEFKVWLHQKKRGFSTWDKFQFALFVDVSNGFNKYSIR